MWFSCWPCHSCENARLWFSECALTCGPSVLMSRLPVWPLQHMLCWHLDTQEFRAASRPVPNNLVLATPGAAASRFLENNHLSYHSRPRVWVYVCVCARARVKLPSVSFCSAQLLLTLNSFLACTFMCGRSGKTFCLACVYIVVSSLGFSYVVSAQGIVGRVINVRYHYHFF